MSDDLEQFERGLSRQPFRQVPAEWRDEILVVASRPSRVEGRGQGRLRRPFLSTLSTQLSIFLWPHPVAWAGLAAVWIFIFAADFSARDRTVVVAAKNSPPPVEVMVEVRQQQELLAELLGLRDNRAADRSKPLAPQPRSQRAEMLAA